MTCAIIPTYNNAATLGDIIKRVITFLPHVIVVIDGATDNTREVIQQLALPLIVLDNKKNRGKGYALKTGLTKAREMGFTHALTIDSDGQHFPEDIPQLLRIKDDNPDSFIIGNRNIQSPNMPSRNTFANKFSNFWFTIQTGIRLPDTQSGMRIYPLKHIHALPFLTTGYEAELELLVFAAWAGEKIISQPVKVHYDPENKQISHFKPARDFLRISLLNTILCIMAILYGWPRTILRDAKKKIPLLGLFLLPFFSFTHSTPHLPSHVEGNKRLYAFPAPQTNNTGMGIIICPGGSYSWLSLTTEGTDIARWLQSIGINAFVLKYRVADVSAYIFGYRILGIGHKYPDMLDDIQTALQYVYRNAAVYHIDTAKIGVMGFSAGGHLAMASFLYNNTPCKPHFICSVYPVVSMSSEKTHKRSRRGALGVWGQFNRHMRDSLSLEKHITPDCPPVFLLNCKDDPVVHFRNSLLLDSALTANHINHRYIQYPTGGHGFGINPKKTNINTLNWKNEFEQWIKNILP